MSDTSAVLSHYSLLIQWSDEDQTYVVSFPEWVNVIGHTHGATYEEAARNGREVLEMLIESAREDGEPLPEPHRFDAYAPA